MRVNTPLIVHDEFDGEVMAVRNDTGTYYSMQGSAAFVWAAVAAGLDVDHVAQATASAYGLPVDQVRADVASFVAQLVAEQLVVDGDPPSGGGVSTSSPAEPYAAPELSAYTDMKDLLLFDPILEVRPDGSS